MSPFLIFLGFEKSEIESIVSPKKSFSDCERALTWRVYKILDFWFWSVWFAKLCSAPSQ